MDLPEHHESLVMFVYLKGSVEMFFSLTAKKDLRVKRANEFIVKQSSVLTFFKSLMKK